MDFDRIVRGELHLLMEKTECSRIAKLNVLWNEKNKTLVIINKKKKHYEAFVIKVSLVGEDRMKRITAKATADEISMLSSLVASKIHHVNVMGKTRSWIRDPHTALYILLNYDDADDEEQDPIIAMPQQHYFPEEGGLVGYVCDRKMQPTAQRIYVTSELLLHHVIMTGTTGFGKSSLLRRVVTETNKDDVTVLVLTPEAHLKKWRTLSNSVVVDDEMFDGRINITDLSHSDNLKEESSEILTTVIEKYATGEEIERIRLLLVIDEAEEFDQDSIENCVRSLRKYGIGIILVYHKFTGKEGVDGSIRTNVSTHISTHTTWDPDIQDMKRYQSKKGIDYAGLLRNAPKGYCVIRSTFINGNQPVLCKFLQEYEKSQTIETSQKEGQSVENSAFGKRRMVIFEIIKKVPDSTSSTVEDKLKKRGVQVDSSTISRDLDWLENNGFITVSRTGEKNKKYYRTVGS